MCSFDVSFDVSLTSCWTNNREFVSSHPHKHLITSCCPGNYHRAPCCHPFYVKSTVQYFVDKVFMANALGVWLDGQYRKFVCRVFTIDKLNPLFHILDVLWRVGKETEPDGWIFVWFWILGVESPLKIGKHFRRGAPGYLGTYSEWVKHAVVLQNIWVKQYVWYDTKK